MKEVLSIEVQEEDGGARMEGLYLDSDALDFEGLPSHQTSGNLTTPGGLRQPALPMFTPELETMFKMNTVTRSNYIIP